MVQRPGPGMLADGDDINIHRVGFRECDTQFLAGNEQPFNTGCKAYSRGGLPPNFFNQQVISSATAQGILCTEVGTDQLESGACIIIQTSYQVRVFGIGYLKLIQMGFDLCIVFFRFLAQVIGDYRGIGDKVLIFFFLGIKDSQGILLQPIL